MCIVLVCKTDYDKKGKKGKKTVQAPPRYTANVTYSVMIPVMAIRMPNGCRAYTVTTNDFISYYVSDGSEDSLQYHQLSKMVVDKRQCYEHIIAIKKMIGKLITGVMIVNRLVRFDDITSDAASTCKLMLARLFPPPLQFQGIQGELPRVKPLLAPPVL